MQQIKNSAFTLINRNGSMVVAGDKNIRSVKILSVAGKLLKSVTLNNQKKSVTIITDDLKSGCYFFVINNRYRQVFTHY